LAVINTTPWPISRSVVEVDLSKLEPGVELYGGKTWRQLSASKRALVTVDDLPPMSVRTFGVGNEPDGEGVTASVETDGGFSIENAFVTLRLDKHGRVTSLYDKGARRETIAPNQLANVFKLFEDVPLYWDAWDVEVYHLEKGWDAGVGEAVLEENGPVRVVVKVRHPLTERSWLEQRICVSDADGVVVFDTKVEWDENRVLLKVEFPVDIYSDVATYETQFGVVQRPTHYNTSWDLAKFEVCAHKFADLSEYGFGVALMNDCKYGHSIKDNVMRMSLLKSPKAPDANTDIGTHVFRYALYPHRGSFDTSDVVQRAYQFNQPPIVRPTVIDRHDSNRLNTGAYFEVDKPNFVIDTVKRAEDTRDGLKDGKDVVVRFYEACGGRGVTTFTSRFKIKEANICNIMEDVGEKVEVYGGGYAVKLEFTPFKILSLRLILE
ncbi:Glycoside hydrolase, 38 vacuolar alpha mannosidase, partial [Dinochytrium kinnereticum]